MVQVVENLENVKQIEVKPNGRAEFELNMKISDPNSAIELFKVRVKDAVTGSQAYRSEYNKMPGLS